MEVHPLWIFIPSASQGLLPRPLLAVPLLPPNTSWCPWVFWGSARCCGWGAGLDECMTFASYLLIGASKGQSGGKRRKRRQGGLRVPFPGHLPIGLLKVTALKTPLATFCLTSRLQSLPHGPRASGLQQFCDFSLVPCSPAPSLPRQPLWDIPCERS